MLLVGWFVCVGGEGGVVTVVFAFLMLFRANIKRKETDVRQILGENLTSSGNQSALKIITKGLNDH